MVTSQKLGSACTAGRFDKNTSLRRCFFKETPPRVKVPPPGGIFMKKTPPYEGVLSVGNPKKAETSATQAERVGERGGECREVKRRAGRGRNDSLVVSKASNTSTDLS